MKIASSLASLSLAASLFLTPHAHAQKSYAGQPSPAPPSVLGGAPITVAVYNFTGTTFTPYFVTPTGILQPLPNAGPLPPTGSKPVNVPTFRGITVVYKGPKGGGVWKHFGGSPAPFLVIGNPPPGTVLPGTTAPTVVNQTIVNNPPAGKRGPNAPVSVTINPPTSPGATPPTSTPSPSSATPAPAAKADSEGELQLSADDPRVVEFLRIHNAARKDVGVSPLEWSEDLAATAQEWADQLALSGKLEHQPDSEYGENFASGNASYTPASAANAWLAEKAKYSPDAEPKYRVTKTLKGKAPAEEDSETAHYTQMVWRKSTMVGFGIAKMKSGKVVVVANYNPRGNLKGERPY